MKRWDWQPVIFVLGSCLATIVLLSPVSAASPSPHAKQVFRGGRMPAGSHPVTITPTTTLFHSVPTIVRPSLFVNPGLGSMQTRFGNLPFANTGQPIAQMFSILGNAQVLGEARFLANPARFYGAYGGGMGYGGMGYGGYGYGGYGGYGMMMPSYGGYGGGSQGMNYGGYGMMPNGAAQALYNNSSNAAPAQPASRPAAGPLAGLVDAQGGLDWPLALRILPPGPQVRALRQQIDASASEVQRQTNAGQVNPALIQQMNRDVDTLSDLLADRAGALPISQQGIAEGGQFIQRLRDALKTVQ